ncbi:hypothetical protein LguiA_026913 [Lonicera macranthoides]
MTSSLSMDQVRKLLDDDPRNSEYADMEKELAEVIALTEELLATAKLNEQSGFDVGIIADVSPGLQNSERTSQHNIIFKLFGVMMENVEHSGTMLLLRHIHQMGILCITTDGAIRKRQALKRKIAKAAAADSDFQSRSLPAKLLIEPDDPEDVKAAKRKKIHAFKSKMRMEQLEVTQNKRQNAWQQFQTTKGRAKKIGFFSGRKRESIFKSPDDPFGKVGVTGSGKGLTEFQKREKHLHLKGGGSNSADSTDE